MTSQRYTQQNPNYLTSMQPSAIQIDQDLIDELCTTPECQQLFERVIGRSATECLLTDLSALSDFVGCGVDAPKLMNLSYSEYLDAWDKWAIDKVRAEFGIELERTSITLVRLIERLRQRPCAIH